MQTLLEKIKQIKWNNSRLITVVVIVVVVFLMMDFNNRMMLLLQLEQQESILETKAANLEQTKLSIEADIAYAQSDRAVEEWAREKDRKIEAGDYPIIIIPAADNAPAPTPELPAEISIPSRFEIWKELFFGTP